MANQTIFKRYEYKYLLTADQKKDLQAYMETYMKPDTFGRNTICNLYFDTPDYLLIRRSIEGKVYKEKIRLRTYGRAQDDSEAFIELKKKYKKVVYKRRVRTEYADAVRYLCQGEDSIEHSQIRRELDYAMQMYQGIRRPCISPMSGRLFMEGTITNFGSPLTRISSGVPHSWIFPHRSTGGRCWKKIRH